MVNFIPVSIALIVKNIDMNGFEIWFQKRKDKIDALNDKWEAPGGKWEEDETPLEACVREVREEVGVHLQQVHFFKDYFWNYEKGPSVMLHAFLAKRDDSFEGKGEWFKIDYDEPLKNLGNKIPAANNEIIIELAQEVRQRVEKKSWNQLWES